MFPSRGATLGIFLLCATVVRAQPATAVGIVVDSLRGRPLAGATVLISDAETQAATDSTGRFRIDSIPPGEHTMAVFHPWLDAIGLSLTTNKITFAAGQTMAVVLATPSAATWIAHHCSDAERSGGTAAIMGQVLQLTTDDPVAGALVRYTAIAIHAGKDIGLTHTTVTRDAGVQPDGNFFVCGVPAGSAGTIRATRGGFATGEIPVDLSGQPIAAITLRLANSDTLAHRTGFVTGTVMDDKRTPIPAARVTLRGGQQYTQTTDSGTFALRELPLGSQVIDVAKVGFPAIGTTVIVLPTGVTVAAITLASPSANAGDAGLASVGFVRRRLAGGGTFLTAGDVAKQKAHYIGDLQPLLPDLMRTDARTGSTLAPSIAGVARCIFYLLDGVQYRAGPSLLNEAVRAVDIVGLEYYQYGHVPKELSDRIHVVGFPRCSLIAIWTNATAAGPG
jgi:Carboxypeptidase regulatory-like domain